MNTVAARFAHVLSVALGAVAFASAPVAAATPACSTDVFTIDGTQLTVEICLPEEAATSTKVTLTERFTVKGQPPLERPLSVDVLPKARTSRSIDDVSLAKLGIAKSLHLTIVYKPDAARLEHALLVPGAIALK